VQGEPDVFRDSLEVIASVRKESLEKFVNRLTEPINRQKILTESLGSS